LSRKGAVETDEVLRAIAEPNRRAILQLVATQEMAAGEIAANFAVTRPAVSQHLTVLKDAGLVSERRDGTRRLYRARPEGLAELRTFLAQMWPDTLVDFKARAEATAPPMPRSFDRPGGRSRQTQGGTGS
jgi:DNA-binding transcriptional ArsR family regulator